ncbi:PREDICTED: elongation of fatty acids protein 3-like [Nelumbo nucifera]|uniref:very-long-chain 3-oxoacyl-CoA synthase n=1 Tax=Nelumbo nucifera TaxID=4432 RepID=A0A1U8B102_NELNU|nr:PREDICTED: elongation of fatty acids protein 3-like [Nelumbo nucifera]
MEWIHRNVSYWLVEHPVVRDFEWKEGETWGSSPKFTATAVITYLSIVGILHKAYLSTKSMTKTLPTTSSPPPFIRLLTAAHSLFLVVLSLIMALGCILSTIAQKPNNRWIFCFPYGTRPRGPVFFWFYVFGLSKVVEFMDTLLIILGKSKRRLTFLHVYHHTITALMTPLGFRAPMSLIPIAMVTNCSVHVLMYTYYMLCALGRRPWWKRLVTDIQIVQFILSFLVSAVMLWYHFMGDGCTGFPIWCISAVISASFLALFLDFRTKNYSSGRSTVRGGQKKEDNKGEQEKEN